jgi:hypothetical protein
MKVNPLSRVYFLICFFKSSNPSALAWVTNPVARAIRHMRKVALFMALPPKLKGKKTTDPGSTRT